ncbi:glycosyl hydrolase-related protein [Gottfriedia acidiceleris]|uniref:glycosyl hydrolase-related protein n=1 Tax=Gottfriedia acidiceleris TaxID=371036 RepID=UPI002FFE712D
MSIRKMLFISFFNERSQNVVLSTLKKAEKVDKFVIHFYNSSENEEYALLQFNDEIDQVYTVNLYEKIKEEVCVNNQQVGINLKSNQVKSILF